MTERSLISALLVTTLTGCAATAPPKVVIPEVPRIGLLLLIDAQPKHVHTGTTVFNNGERLAVSDWKSFDAIRAHAQEQIEGAEGQTVVDVPATSNLLNYRFDLTVAGWDTFKFNEKATAAVDEAVAGRDLDFILVVEPFRLESAGPGIARSGGYGIQTACFLGSCGGQGLANVTARVYALHPTRLVSWGEASKYRFPLEIDSSGDMRNLPKSEIDRARGPVMEHIFERMDSAIDKAGLIRKKTPRQLSYSLSTPGSDSRNRTSEARVGSSMLHCQ